MKCLNSLWEKMKTRKGLVIIGIVILVVGSGVAIGIKIHRDSNEKQKQERAEKEKQDKSNESTALILETVNKLYTVKVMEYHSIVRAIKDWDYSERFRVSQIRELDKLIGYNKYMSEYNKYNELQDVIIKINTEESNDKKWLYQNAMLEVREWIEDMYGI